MKRRNFIKKAGIATAGMFVAPYILPSGRLFAASGTKLVDHVVFCLFAGGVRNIESIKQDQSNLLTTMFNGTFQSQTGIDAILPASPFANPNDRLQKYGKLYREFRYAQGPTGHFNGHVTAVTGKHTQTDLNFKAHPDSPTVFEYYRKLSDPSNPKSALNAWWVSDSLGPYPALNYSKEINYGSTYGANYLQPASLISLESYNQIGNPKIFSSADDAEVKKLRAFFNNNYKGQYSSGDAGVTNTETDAENIRNFINQLYLDAVAGGGIPSDLSAWGFGALLNNDLVNIYYAEKVLEKYKPELLVVNMTAVDVCHRDFTNYCNNLRLADWGVSHLWNKIETTSGMMGNTLLVVVPEHGRNFLPNTVVDQYGRYAIDHTTDDTSREIFALFCGPNNVVKRGGEELSVKGNTVDIVPTVLDVLGISPSSITSDGSSLKNDLLL